MAEGGPQLGRWCRTCRVWVSLRDRSCPECRGKVGGPELMPAGTVPISGRKVKEPKPAKEPKAPKEPRSSRLRGGAAAVPGPDLELPPPPSYGTVSPTPPVEAPPPVEVDPPAPLTYGAPHASAPPPPPVDIEPPAPLTYRAPHASAPPPPPVDIDPPAPLTYSGAVTPPPPAEAPPPPPPDIEPPVHDAPPPPDEPLPPPPDPPAWEQPAEPAPAGSRSTRAQWDDEAEPPPGSRPPRPSLESEGPAAPAGQVRSGWNNLPPIKGLDDAPPPPPPDTASGDGDGEGMSRQTMIRIGVGAVAIFLLGFILLEVLSGGESDSAEDATPPTQVPVEASIPFTPPEVPADEPLEEPTVVPAEQWDPLVRDLIPFIEEARGLRFKEPVAIEVGTAAELNQRYPSQGLDPITEQYLNDILGMYRALGIYEGGADLNSLVNQDLSWGVNQYDPQTKTVTITSDAGGPDAVAFRQAVLVHEMVHALQDQHFGDTSTITYDKLTMRRMMWEGDAVRIETEFAATMSEADRASYEALEASLRRSTDQGIIEVLGVEGQFIYLGGHEVTRLAEILESDEAVNRLVEYPPTRPAQLLRVSTLFLHEGQPWADDTELPAFPVPDDGFLIDGGSLGAWLWYVAMSTHMDPTEALRASEAIGSDRYVLFERNGQICANFEVVASGAGDAGHMVTGMRNWSASLPHAPVVTVDGRSVRVEVCDPGVGASMNFARPPQDVVTGPIARLRAVADVLQPQRGWWATDPLRERERWCLAETVQRSIPVDEALAGLSPERVTALGESAVETCLAERVPGGLPPILTECSAAGLPVEIGNTTLPREVAAAREAVVEAAVACDYEALRTLMAEQGPYLGEGAFGQAERSGAVVERWQRLEERQHPVLAEMVATLQGGWMCGPGVLDTIEGGSGDGCAFLSAGSSPVDDNAWVAVFDLEGGLLGFASNGGTQGAVLEIWAETVTGARNRDTYTLGGAQGASGLPRGWPVGIPPAALLEEL